MRRNRQIRAASDLRRYQGVMNVIFRVLQTCLGMCRHTHTIRERRKLHGVDVLHLVCENCGYAVPAIERTAREHQRIVKAGAIRPVHPRRASADVVDLDLRRDRRRVAS
jgi:hypothetical protein